MNGKDGRHTVTFRFIPTMNCNLHCEYCFLSDEEKRNSKTMFDEHSPEEWVDGMKRFESYNIEPYFWGGEPFCIDGTYEILKEWVKMDHIISGFRIDTNAFFAKKIAMRCPSNKIKLNLSYHMQFLSLEEEYRNVKLLKDLDMVGMVNFVASPYNLSHLRDDYGMTVMDLIEKFGEIGVFVNIAGDFAYANDTNYERYDDYRMFIQQFISPEEWKWFRGVSTPRECEAGQKYFIVENDGTFMTCLDDQERGNFFRGELRPDDTTHLCKKNCLAMIRYSLRCDNNFPTVNSMLAYVERNNAYRNSRSEDFVDFTF